MTQVRAFPWERLPHVERAGVVARREIFGRLLCALDPQRLPVALSQLLGEDVELLGAQLSERRRPERAQASFLDPLVVQFPAHGVRFTLWPEPDLLRVCVARLLEQEFELGWADTGVDAALRGAGAALVLEVARRAARGEAPELTTEGLGEGAWLLFGHATLCLAGKPYRFELCAEPVALDRPLPVSTVPVGLSRLGAVRLRVPWVCAVSCVSVATLRGLEVGDVWLPGKSAWLGGETALSAAILAPCCSELGQPIRVSGGRIVLGAEAVRVHEELEASMGQEETELEQIVGQTPLVVRLEVGALEMSAAEWAALRPGDVVQSGRRIEDAVILRAGGREIARGELVEIEGEIGVRITHVGAAVLP